MRNLVLVLGDQLNADASAFDGFDRKRDAVLQLEVREEATYIPQHKMRLVMFFSAMRHFRDAQRALGREVHYRRLDDPDNKGSLAAELAHWCERLRPERIILTEPGDWRVEQALRALNLRLVIRVDRHFLISRDGFAEFAGRDRKLILETFYRQMRKRLGILMDANGDPVGGAWNFDKDNRKAFPASQSSEIPPPLQFAPDRTTSEVMALVARIFPEAPGRLDSFNLPVTREQALAALDDFCRRRLSRFGAYQDAMVRGQPYLFHSGLSAPLNLHLLAPGEVIKAALKHARGVPLASLEGFVRQIIGWREFVHGTYWRLMPEYGQRNELGAELPVPRFYWTAETDMHCLAEATQSTIDHAYAHHIQRLMVLGLYCLLLGADPQDVHRWHMSMFRDSIDWVSLPNTLGMSQHADGGVVGTKPYVASGHYINRMSNSCKSCRYNPAKATGAEACPFTTLYWDFLARHKERFERNPRMVMQYRNLARKSTTELRAIRRRADAIKARSPDRTPGLKSP